MLKWLGDILRKTSGTTETTDESKAALEKLLMELKDKEEMKMLLKDFTERNKEDKGGGSASSPVSSP